MNPDYRETESASDKALNDWKKSIPLNRAGRRNQLSKYKYYLELNESETFWSVYGVKKDGSRFMIDNSANHVLKKEVEEFTPEVSLESPAVETQIENELV